MRHRLIAATALAALALSGCDWFGSGSSADTSMKNVEILPGTASDEMITLDQASGDGTAIDGSTAIGPGQPAAATDGAAADSDGDTPVASDDGSNDESSADGGSESGDVVIRPPAGGAEPDEPAKK